VKPDQDLQMVCADQMTILAPDAHSRGLQARSVGGYHEAQGQVCVLDLPLEPAQMRTVAAWLIDMAAEKEEGR